MAVARGLLEGAAAGVIIKVAHSLYRHWERMPASQRDRLKGIAHDVKDRALDLRGVIDRSAAERALERANEQLAAAISESAGTDPWMDDAELESLRAELARELARMADGKRTRP